MTRSAGWSGLIFCGIAAEELHGVAHGGEVDDGGDAGEVLQEDAGGHEGDFAGGLGFGVPFGEEVDVGGGDGFAVFVAEEVFEEDAEAEGKAMEGDSLFLESAEAEDFVGFAAGFQLGLAAEGVHDVSFRGERRRGSLRSRVGRRSGSGAANQTEAGRPRS